MSTMTNAEASELFQALNKGVFAGLKGAKFSYALVRTKDILKRELQILEDSFKEKETFNEFEAKRIELATKLCEKNEAGEPDVEQNKFKFSSDNDVTFKAELKKLQEEYKEALDERSQQIDNFNKMLAEPVSYEVHKIAFVDVPEDISQEQMEILYPMILE